MGFWKFQWHRDHTIRRNQLHYAMLVTWCSKTSRSYEPRGRNCTCAPKLRLLRSYDLEKLQQQQQQQQRQEHQEQLHHLLEHGHRRPIIQDESRNARTDTDLLNIVQSQTASMKAHAKHLGKCDVNYAPSGGNLLPVHAPPTKKQIIS